MTVKGYRVCCPHCGEEFSLPATTLEGIVRNQLASSKDALLATLICHACLRAYQWDWKTRDASLAVLDESSLAIRPFVRTCRVGCGDSNCKSQIVLIAIRPPDTTKTTFDAEFERWNVDGICCVNGHPVLFPGSSRTDPEGNL